MQAASADATVCGGCMVSSGALAGGAVITVPTTAPPTALPRVGVCAARRRGDRADCTTADCAAAAGTTANRGHGAATSTAADHRRQQLSSSRLRCGCRAARMLATARVVRSAGTCAPAHTDGSMAYACEMRVG